MAESSSLRERLRTAAMDAMLDAAERTMVQRGYDKATMQEIAAAAGCAVGTLYLHFKTKEELFHGIVRRHAVVLNQRIAAAVEAAGDPLAKLEALYTAHFLWGREHIDLLNLLCSALPVRYYDFERALGEITPVEHGQFKATERELIEAGQAHGQIRRDITPECLSELVRGLLLTVMDQYAAKPEMYPFEERVRMVWGFVVEGLRAREEGR